MLGPTLQTPRLILRPPLLEDLDAYAAFMADERTARHLGGVVPRAVAWRQLATIVGAWSLNGFSMFSFVERSTGKWIGRGGPWMPEGWPGTEVGWGVAVEAQQKGYAKEAAAAAIDWAFDTLGWSEVIHCISHENGASVATARSLGSVCRQTGVAAPPPLVASWDIYAQSREAWRARRSS